MTWSIFYKCVHDSSDSYYSWVKVSIGNNIFISIKNKLLYIHFFW